jgi:hypothetical protein
VDFRLYLYPPCVIGASFQDWGARSGELPGNPAVDPGI